AGAAGRRRLPARRRLRQGDVRGGRSRRRRVLALRPRSGRAARAPAAPSPRPRARGVWPRPHVRPLHRRDHPGPVRRARSHPTRSGRRHPVRRAACGRGRRLTSSARRRLGGARGCRHRALRSLGRGRVGPGRDRAGAGGRGRLGLLHPARLSRWSRLPGQPRAGAGDGHRGAGARPDWVRQRRGGARLPLGARDRVRRRPALHDRPPLAGVRGPQAPAAAGVWSAGQPRARGRRAGRAGGAGRVARSAHAGRGRPRHRRCHRRRVDEPGAV
ncbi:MAG: hypothetical protein AVDCRST_MAG59-4097, partial [uncultured Thermomicrobiales bacterium]